MKTHSLILKLSQYALLLLVTLCTALLCICVGSVNIPAKDTLSVIWDTLSGQPVEENVSGAVIAFVRLPRVLCVALAGASLSLCGCAMQGLLRNPLADGSTLGVSSGASVGAVLAIAFGISVPGVPLAGTMAMAMLFAFLSLMIILALSYRLDASLSTNTIILIGIVFNMFSSSVISLITSFAGDKVKDIVFWTMGSLADSSVTDVWTILGALLIFGTVILRYAKELNAFAIGEDNARNVGVDVKKVKLIVMIAVSALIGVCVSIGGVIGFVGLIIPHMTRMIVGPNHRRLLPATLFSGAIFLMLADLLARIILKPLELHIGVVTSVIGSFVFIFIFYTTRKAK